MKNPDRKKIRSFSVPIGLPSALIAMSWIGIWFLWPTGAGQISQGDGARSSFRVNYMRFDLGQRRQYKDPTSITLPFRYGFVLEDIDKRSVPEPIGLQSKRPPLFLSMDAYIDNSQETGNKDRMWFFSEVSRDFVARFKGVSVFESSVPGELKLTVDLDGSLQDLGFEFPEQELKDLKADSAWYFDAVVYIDVYGRVEHVFIEGGNTGQKEAAIIARTLEKGYIQKSGKNITGRIVINYGSK